jgi:NAD(P)-dependent dehydrogenase (short-subunit alcohol dehydrogenase family)
MADGADRPLAGRTALVTGAGRGIGRRIAVRLAEAGAEVFLAGRSQAGLDETAAAVVAAGGVAHTHAADLTVPDQVRGLAAAAEAAVGAPDVVVSNCGIAGRTAPLWEQSESDWGEVIAVNLTAPYLLLHELLPAIVARGSGSVVVVGSATGKRPLPGRTPYAASKMALVGLVRTLAWEVGAAGVRVNLVSPGPVAGERLRRVVAAQGEARGVAPSAVVEEMAAGSPLRRITEPDDIADAVLYLAGDGAAGVTGEDLDVSSGWVMYG